MNSALKNGIPSKIYLGRNACNVPIATDDGFRHIHINRIQDLTRSLYKL